MGCGIWKAIEVLADGHRPAAVLAEWQNLTGADYGTAGMFLRPTSRLADDYPCPKQPGCGLRRELVPMDGEKWMARCEREIGTCRGTMLAKQDVCIYELDAERFGGAVGNALGFEAAGRMDSVSTSPKIWPAGTHTETRSPVFLALCPNDGQLLLNLEGLISSCGEPFILLTPTSRVRSEAVGSLLQRERCALIPLAAYLAPDGARFQTTAPVMPVLERFKAGLSIGKGLVRTVENINRNLEAVARNQYELRKENDELRQLNKDGYFNFAVRVKGEDFMAFAVIMALGNRKAAADHLKIPHRTFYDRVDQWAERGKDYQLMLRYMEWRKRSSRQLKVELTPSLQSGESGDQSENPETMGDVLTEIDASANSQDYPALLADLLQALERQNAGNWKSVRDELLTIIKEDLPQ